MRSDYNFTAYNLFVGLLIPKEGARTFEETHELPQSFFADFQAEMGNKLWSDVIAGASRSTHEFL